MKKYLSVLFGFCLLCFLVIPALASEGEPDFIAEYEAKYGKVPAASDFSDPADYQAAYDIWYAGLVPYINRRTAEEGQKKAAAEKEVSSDETTLIESEGTNHVDAADPSVFSSPAAQYPDRVRTDLAGNVYSLDGTLLSPGTTPAMEPDNASTAGPNENDALLSGELSDQADISSVPDPDTLTVIAGLVSDIATDPPVYTVEDLRSSDPPAEVLTGLKSMVTSIFGEYTPVTTTSVISETVGNDTHQYLVETVAPGAAGVDYEWVAGVALFAIMLYCLMKLLGGVLK